MTNLSNQVALDALAAAFGFHSAEHAGEYVRGLVEARFVEEEFGAALKLMLAPAIAEGESAPDSWHVYLFASDIQVDGASIRFSYMSPVTVAGDEKAMVAASEALQAYSETVATGEELLHAAFDPAALPVPCNRVWVESSVAQMVAYGTQRYVRNTVTNVVRPTGAPFVPVVIQKSVTPAAPAPAETGASTVVPLTPRKR